MEEQSVNREEVDEANVRFEVERQKVCLSMGINSQPLKNNYASEIGNSFESRRANFRNRNGGESQCIVEGARECAAKHSISINSKARDGNLTQWLNATYEPNKESKYAIHVYVPENKK